MPGPRQAARTDTHTHEPHTVPALKLRGGGEGDTQTWAVQGGQKS